MFMDGLNEEQIYELLRYSLRIISKTTANPDFVTFLGVKIIPICRFYINTKFEPLLIEIFVFIAFVARDHSHFDKNIIETNIVMKIKDWLTDEKFTESVREKALYMIGNMAKKS